ncbi:YceD family protein [Wielerella bovis]|uniref:YceD family protein n=1 Tax=Wielerella bovis TaxID=2917790 RepID=UPI00201882A2|nr:YceD family protein [Wielerella bovis]ULJ60655.1 YceD family protein [Wielerella bovis]
MLNRILIDPQAFAIKQETRDGSVLLNQLDKRTWSPDIADTDTYIHYTLTGGVDRWQRPFLDLSVSGSLKLHCQRCMSLVDFPMNEQAHIVLFDNEGKLDEAMLADDDLEGMILTDELDILTLVEDQLLMALPISPKHDDCGNVSLNKVNQDKPNPFGVLAGLKKG